MSRWGNALGGWRKQKRNAKGQFGSGVIGSAKSSARKRAAAGKAHRSRKKANARAHRARVKGSVKNRGREFVTTSPRRTKDVTVGAAAYTLGRSSGSARMQSYGLHRTQKGVKASAGRSSATYHMSKGLKESRNRRSKDQYLADIGSSRKKRNAMKLAAGAAAVGATAYALKKGAIYGEVEESYRYLAVGRDVKRGAPGFVHAQFTNKRGVAGPTASVKFGKAKKSVDLGPIYNKANARVDKTHQRAAKMGFVI